MTMKIYTVYDQKAEAYLQPFFTPTKGLAMRSFIDAVNKEGHDFNRYAPDYTLFEIGEYEDQTGQIKMHKHMENLGKANEYLKTNPTPDWNRQDNPNIQELQKAAQGRKEQQKKGQELNA